MPSLLLFFRQRRLNRDLLLAVDHGQVDDVRRLLDQGADANSSDGYDSVLCRAGRSPKSNADTLKLLLEHGASLSEVPVGRGEAPLVRAAHWSDDTRICLLIQAGANVNTLHRWSGNSPLQELVQWASLQTIDLLLDRGAEANHQNFRDGRTALHFATICARLDVVKLLINRGGLVDITDRYDKTPLTWAKQIVGDAADQSSKRQYLTPEFADTIAFLEGTMKTLRPNEAV